MDQFTVTSEEIVQSTKKASNRIQRLNSFDIGNVYTEFYYYFKNEREQPSDKVIENVKQGIKVMIDEYPEVAGTIDFDQSKRYLSYDNHGV